MNLNHLGLAAMSEDETIAFSNRCDAMRMAINIMLNDQMDVISGKETVENFCGVIDSVVTSLTREKDAQGQRRERYRESGMDPDEAER